MLANSSFSIFASGTTKIVPGMGMVDDLHLYYAADIGRSISDDIVGLHGLDTTCTHIVRGKSE